MKGIVPFKGRSVDPGRPVWIYRNLRPGKSMNDRAFSVMQDGLVVGHSDYIRVKDAKFVVREGGRQRVLREKRKNVHAFVVGTVIDPMTRCPGRWHPVRYNPYVVHTFVRSNPGTGAYDLPVYSASYVELSRAFVRGQGVK